MKINPRDDQVLVKPQEPPGKTKGGILLPENTRDKRTTRGEVIAVGEGKWVHRYWKVDGCEATDPVRQATGLEVGQVVVFNRYAGTEIEEDGETFLLMGADEIKAVLS